MDLHNKLRACLDLDILPRGLLADWSESLRALSAGGVPYVTEPFVREQAAFLDFDAELTQVLVEGLRVLQPGSALRFLCTHAHRRWFVLKQEIDGSDWPLPSVQAHPLAPLVYAYAFLAAVPAIRKDHAQRGIEERVTRDTLRGLGIYTRRFRRWNGHWGFRQHGWLGHHYQGAIHRLGRLEFGFEEWRHPAWVFRNTLTGRVRILAEDGLQCAEDGVPADAAGRHDPKCFWVTCRSENEQSFIGNPVLRGGRVLQQMTALRREEHELCLKPGDSILATHIIEGEPLAIEACAESFREAVAFHRKHFPGRPWKAFACKSWMLDPQFATVLPPGSNIRRFMHAFHLVPCHDAKGMGFEQFVFDRRVEDLLKAPRDTHLRRCMVEHVERGGAWCGGAGFLLPDEVAQEDWGRAESAMTAELTTGNTAAWKAVPT